jgi:hypothetical protein
MTTSIQNNPLAKHFRQPAIYLKLPSNGKYWPDGALEMPVTGEIPVYSMTIKDELLLRTPDALMNGASMAEMITSCCPSIKDPWSIPLIDLDPIFIAIRIASYGGDMDMISSCPHCQVNNEHTVGLNKVLESVNIVKNYNQTTYIDGLTFELKPQTFKDLNRADMITFEQRKLLEAIEASDLEETEKKQRFLDSFTRLTDLNLDTIVSCISGITTETGERVSNPELLRDFLKNCDRKVFDNIKTTITEVVGANKIDTVPVECTECKQPYTLTLEFNQSNFFG